MEISKTFKNWFGGNISKQQYNTFTKKWLHISFTIAIWLKGDKELTKKSLKEAKANYYNFINQKLMEHHIENLVNKGINPMIISEKPIAKRKYLFDNKIDLLTNPQVKHKSFKIIVNKAKENKNIYTLNYIFDPFSLEEYLFEGYALYSTNDDLCKLGATPLVAIKKGEMAQQQIGFDKEGDPIIINYENFIIVNYKVKDRVRQAKYDHEYDKICHETTADTLKRIKKQTKEPSETSNKWFTKVEQILKSNS